jgi:hypothetical protein
VRTQSPPSFQPPPQYIAPPQPTHIPLPATQYYPEASPAYPVNQFDPQLEFDFSLTEQKKTNELLEKNNKLLQKLISLLESKNKDETIKLETKIKGIQSIPQKSFKD